MRVLVVDDRPRNLDTMVALLSEPGREVVTACGGQAALRALLRDDFAVVLLDVHMPDIDGMEVARLMRSNKRTARTPIIFVTGSARAQEQVFEGYESGAVDYLIKPVDNHVLRSKVAVYEQLHRQNEQLHRQRAALERSVHELSSASEALRASEAAQRTLNEVLEERVHERTRDLEAANRDLEAFAHSVAHNLRTPLRSIASFVDIVTAEADLSADHADLLERVTHAAANMSELLNGLLRLSEIRQVEAHPRDVDLAAQAADVIAARGWQAVEWSVEAPQPTSADPELSRVVLEVLFENAIKFTAEVPAPRVSLTTAVQGDELVHTVRDNGVGFDPAHAGRLFQAFQRLHSPRDFDGVGLGLATARQAVERHGGRIWAESRPGEGAAFHFTFTPGGVLAAP
ncbi:MAG: response regulator [Myxococcales bacterium]|nr:response regulator [Myxococcales bacterium]